MPPVPTSSVSSYRSANVSPTTTRTVPAPTRGYVAKRPCPLQPRGGARHRAGNVTRACRKTRAAETLGEGRLERLLPDAEGLVQLRVRDHERHEYADAVGVDPGLEQE